MNSGKTIRINAAEHPVKSVVVLKSSKAEIVRTFDVALKGGQNKLIISKLPSTIDTQSVRISGLNPGAPKNRTYLSDVVCSLSEASDEASDGPIHALEVKKSILQSEKELLDSQATVLVKYANSLNGEHANPEVMTNFLATFVQHGKTNIHAVAKLEAEIKAIDERIAEEKKKVTLVKGSANMELTATITAENDTHANLKVNLKLTYIVNKTNWSPTYELHAVTGDNGQPSRTVSLHYRACVTQSTGEDWTDASLTLSTVATDSIVKTIPKLDPVRISVSYNTSSTGRALFGQGQQMQQQMQQQPMQQQQMQQQQMQQQQMLQPMQQQVTRQLELMQPMQQMQESQKRLCGSRLNVPGTNLFGSNTGAPPPPPPPPSRIPGSFLNVAAPSALSTFGFGASNQPDHGVITLPEDDDEDDERAEGSDNDETPAKLVTQTPMALTYTVRGSSSIPSDGKEHIVTIALLSFETDVDYVSVPRVDPRVYLQCQVKNNSEYRLLPGPVTTILDDSYVSKTTIFDVNRNDVFNFTLGNDPHVLISYSRLSKTIKEGSGSFADIANITTYTTSITVQNKHNFPIEKLTLRDALPVTDDRRVRVVLRKPKELIEAKEGVLVKVKKETEGEVDDEGLKVRWTKEKEGLYEYRWRIDADGKIGLQTVFEIKASSDLTCTFINWREKAS